MIWRSANVSKPSYELLWYHCFPCYYFCYSVNFFIVHDLEVSKSISTIVYIILISVLPMLLPLLLCKLLQCSWSGGQQTSLSHHMCYFDITVSHATTFVTLLTSSLFMIWRSAKAFQRSYTLFWYQCCQCYYLCYSVNVFIVHALEVSRNVKTIVYVACYQYCQILAFIPVHFSVKSTWVDEIITDSLVILVWRRHFLLDTRYSLETHSLLNEKSLVTRYHSKAYSLSLKIYSLSFKNLLVITQNLLARYYSKTYLLSFKIYS